MPINCIYTTVFVTVKLCMCNCVCTCKQKATYGKFSKQNVPTLTAFEKRI